MRGGRCKKAGGRRRIDGRGGWEGERRDKLGGGINKLRAPLLEGKQERDGGGEDGRGKGLRFCSTVSYKSG